MIRLAKLDKRLALAALLLLSSVMLLDFLTQLHLKEKHQLEQRDALFLKLGSLRHQVEKELTANLLVIQGTANFIAVTDDLTVERFNSYVQEALKTNSLLKNIVAAPDFVLRYVYPLKGNEAVLGKNYKNLPDQWELVQKAYESGSLVVAGPLKLIQGGTGLIGRAPVFVRHGNDKKFWGIVSGVIDMDRLLASITAGSDSADITIAIRGRDGRGLSGDVFLGDESLFTAEEHSVLMPVVFPTGSWVIAAMPKDGWNQTPSLSWMFHLVYLLMGIGITLSVSNALKRNMALEATQEMLNEAQHVARLGNWKLDTQTGSFWWSREFYNILGVDESITRPTLDTFLERIHADDRESVRTACEQFLATGESRGFDCRIIRLDGSIRHIHVANARFPREGIQALAFGTIQDITARKIMEDALVAEQYKFKAMADASYDAFIMIDSNDTILFWSAAAERLFGWTAEEALGKKVHILITPPQYRDGAMKGLEQFRRTGTGMVMNSVMEFRALRKDGSSFPVERSVSAFKIGNEYYAVGHLRDITDRKLTEKKLERMATTDGLTGLTNRARFLEIAAQEMERSKRYNRPVSLIMLDADKFKNVNDTYGHDAGDTVLVNIAETTRSTLRETDTIARIGGEEFVVLMPETEEGMAMQAAERLRAAIENQEVVSADGRIIRYTVSAGVTGVRTDDASIGSVLKRADNALYTAKSAGRNRVCKAD